MPPVLVTKIGEQYALIDGHSRTLALYELGERKINAFFVPLDQVPGPSALYEHIHKEIIEDGLLHVGLLSKVNDEDHKLLWIDYCQSLMKELNI
jgi:hypothetical protein